MMQTIPKAWSLSGKSKWRAVATIFAFCGGATFDF